VGGAAAEGFAKVRHASPILSLPNAFDADSIRAWRERIQRYAEQNGIEHLERLDEVVVEPKIDGLTIVLTYENGLLTQAATRGDGAIGEETAERIARPRATDEAREGISAFLEKRRASWRP
jgi:DNA ligase (NAD+)